MFPGFRDFVSTFSSFSFLHYLSSSNPTFPTSPLGPPFGRPITTIVDVVDAASRLDTNAAATGDRGDLCRCFEVGHKRCCYWRSRGSLPLLLARGSLPLLLPIRGRSALMLLGNSSALLLVRNPTPPIGGSTPLLLVS